MKAIFLADAHLRHPDDDNYRRLEAFLRQLPADVDNLFVLGDFFDFWFGYPAAVFSAYVPILAALEQLARRGVQLYFLAGNHEVNLGPYFPLRLRAHTGDHHLSVNLDHQLVYLAHGDLLDDRQLWYRRWRRLLKSAAMNRLLRAVPPSVAWNIAGRLSAGSRQAGQTAAGIPDHLDDSLKTIFQTGHQAAVIAHFHQAGEKRIECQGRQFPVYFLGDWLTDFSYLELSDGRFRLLTAD
ncbi:MAG: UDP-2,3-diacylglucosamine diphosphatase [Deltaproteobacteria bacterium]|nr:UDP-2,3-diacylglucosamine diphosphatase [Deltaproteobacteria bacterium]